MYNNPYNYYPYMNMNPGFNAVNSNVIRPRSGIIGGISKIKWKDVLNTTQKTLNVINQAIPVYYQIKPIFNNVKSFGRLVSAFNENDSNNNNTNNNISKEKENSSNSPTFFID